MSDPTISDINLYDAVSDTELAQVNSGALVNPPSYARVVSSGVSEENVENPVAVEDNSATHTEAGDGDSEPRHTPAHHGNYLSSLRTRTLPSS